MKLNTYSKSPFPISRHLKRNQPEILFGKCCYDLPMKKVAKLSKVVLASHTGPAGGLLQVNRKQKPFEYLDLDVDFIDEDYGGSDENIDRINVEKEKGVGEKLATEKDVKITLNTGKWRFSEFKICIN